MLCWGRATLGSGVPVRLRLECIGNRVRALCALDDTSWFLVGEGAWAGENECRVGLYAVGDIDRLSYPGAHTEGTGIRFERLPLGVWLGQVVPRSVNVWQALKHKECDVIGGRRGTTMRHYRFFDGIQCCVRIACSLAVYRLQ